jgi:hypothetical protein
MRYDAPGSVSQSEPLGDSDQRASHLPPREPTHPILNLQRTAGNRAVQRFVQTKLTAGRSQGKAEAEANHLPEPVGGSSIKLLIERSTPIPLFLRSLTMCYARLANRLIRQYVPRWNLGSAVILLAAKLACRATLAVRMD